MLTTEQILSKRDLLLNYLSEQGAISRSSGIEDVTIIQKTLRLGKDDFENLCQHLSDAGWIKFLWKAGTWEAHGIGTIWLTPVGFERMHLRSIPKWLTKRTSEETQLEATCVVKTIEDWIPKQRYKIEETYVAALAEFLEGKGIKAPEQKGASLTDILAKLGIGIEVKINPSRGEYDRLCGQIIRQLEEFGIVIVLIIRPDNRDLLEEYKSRFVHDQRVIFIVK